MRKARYPWQVTIMTLMLSVTLCLAQTSSSDTQQPQATTPPTRLPEVTVEGEQLLREESPIGDNNQPEWTARRRFATTRVYVQPPWQIEAETGWDAKYHRSGGGPPSHKLTQEFELGLPCRFQADYEYAETINDGVWRYDSSSFELRWALADWGRIPLNPTVKAEWKIANAAADFYEFSLSLGEELAPRWHWGAELFYEQQVGDDREREYAAAQAVSYSVVDEQLGIGVEMKLKDETDTLDRHSHLEFLVGPSVQWRPTSRTHLDVVALLGATGPSPRVETFVFFGIDFGPGSERHEGITPASLRNK